MAGPKWVIMNKPSKKRSGGRWRQKPLQQRRRKTK